MIQFGGADSASITTFNSFPNGLFISELIDNNDSRIQQFLIKNYLEKGAALFGNESPEEMQDFRNICGGSIDHLSDKETVGIIQFYVQRLRNYAHIESLKQAWIKTARIVSGRTKPHAEICKFYENKIFNVEECLEKIQLLKSLSPQKQGEIYATTDLGFPPLYRLCRCRLEGLIRGIDY